MKKPPLKKFYDLIRFVLLTTFIFYISMLLLDYYLPSSNHGISFFFFNITATNHTQVRKPSTISINSSEIRNYTTIVNATHHEGEIRKNNLSPPPPPPPPLNITKNIEVVAKPPKEKFDPCSGRYVYSYDLPSIFNEDLVKDCKSLNKWFNMCPYLSNLGLGERVIEKSRRKVLLKNSWYVTNQFSLEVIFHEIMKHYKCLTNDSSLASAIYVPYYPGLDVGKYLWDFSISRRDETPKKLMNWLREKAEWKKMMGKDHFMVGGRTGFDFRRGSEDESDWGTKLMFMPEASKMAILPIESSSWDNDFPIPYPTYFHPSKDKEILQWQERMRKMKRNYLFSFAGAPRPNSTYSIRNDLIHHCKTSKSCKLLDCYVNNINYCDDPVHVIHVFQLSVFCLQPPGDSYTRRSTFDSILAGCIPVFFHPNSAYKQYLWHLPKNGSSYSVFIPQQDVQTKRTIIQDTLSRFSKEQVLAMREQVIRMIPSIIYRKPGSRLEKFEDAFDVAVKGVIQRIEGIKRKELL
ncbi:hypothetical protein Lal_00009316 [Lupinus albus]|uniref:Putative exostosin n=1 Tax=Lupinus albus TaxID=3870 RepID=A0A6A5LVK7_LUPAL|nr:putative exostosin [Lupinus albus]KAF1862935.1 hypothetical protein Lal_00009316 [Lupinus albus]